MKAIMVTTAVLIASVVGATAGFESEKTAPVAAFDSAQASPEPSRGAPQLLSETGLYAKGEGTTRIDQANRPFSPQYPLWTDGAQKKRWIYLPAGATIDATNVSRWEFPVGTKFWKEFGFDGHKVETRLIWRVSRERWIFATYAWNDAQTDAVLAPETGIPNAFEVAPGKRHSIPGVVDCASCHVSDRTEIIGFDALQLSDDRDPNAPHAEALSPGMLTIKALVDEGLMTPRRTELVAAPPRIAASSPEARAALGYLSTNCGSCHNKEGSIASLGLHLKQFVTASPKSDAECTPPLATTAGKRGHWVVPEHQEASRLINPGHPESSAIIRRVKSRRPLSQMPPLGSVLVDQKAVDLLTNWVQSDPEGWARMVAACAAQGS